MRTLGGVIVGLLMVVTWVSGFVSGFWCCGYEPYKKTFEAIEEVKED